MEPKQAELVVQQLDVVVGELLRLNAMLEHLTAVVEHELGDLNLIGVKGRGTIVLTPVSES